MKRWLRGLVIGALCATLLAPAWVEARDRDYEAAHPNGEGIGDVITGDDTKPGNEIVIITWIIPTWAASVPVIFRVPITKGPTQKKSAARRGSASKPGGAR